MPKIKNICRVCGKTYEACKSTKHSNTFRWQDVSCSPECGAEYLRRIQASRGIVRDNAKISTDIVLYNEDVYGFDGEVDEEYTDNYGSND